MEDFWSPFQTIIKEVCVNFDKEWQIRRRAIDTNFLVLFIFKLVLSKNRQGYKSILAELWEKPEMATRQESPLSASSLPTDVRYYAATFMGFRINDTWEYHTQYRRYNSYDRSSRIEKGKSYTYHNGLQDPKNQLVDFFAPHSQPLISLRVILACLAALIAIYLAIMAVNRSDSTDTFSPR